jgi:ABC-type multidrug transport system fused ATPase/permease subunit
MFGVDGSFSVMHERVLVVVYILALLVSLYKRRTSSIFVNIACVAVTAVLSGSIGIALLLGVVLFAVDYFMGLRDPLEPFANEVTNEEDNEVAYEEMKEAYTDEKEERDQKDQKEPGPVKPARKAKKAAKKTAPPDNGERAEFFELGKKYKLPSEDDDADFHLDAGSTFMNAYKSLKPDQLAAMTKDTQDLMQTQKQLMSTLQTLKPLIMDGKEMMNTFQSYFGSGSAPTTM